MNDELNALSKYVAAGRLSRRDFLGRAAALGVGAAVANGLIATAVRAEGPVKGGTLKAGMQGGTSTDSLDPATWESQVPIMLGYQIGDGLVSFSPTGEIVPHVAEEIGSSADAKTWTFKIRKGVTFHNGKNVTPEDVVATLERHSDEKSKSGALGLMTEIERIKADGGNVVISLKEANADFPYLMGDYHLMIQPNGGKDNPNEGISCGPYKVVSNEPGVRHVLEKYDGYWNSDIGHASTVEIIVINDATARMSALQSGQVNMINRVEPKIVGLIKRVSGVTVRNVSGRGFYPFNMFCNTAPFDSNDLRLALKYAMNREEMVDRILMGYGSIGNDIPINKAYPLSPDDLEQRPFDPDKAAFHYKKSGLSGTILLRTSDVAFPGAVDAAQLYQQSCAQAGITLDVKREPGDGYWAEVWNKQPFSTSYWGGRPTQDQMYSAAYYSKAEWNDTRFFNEKFDQLLLAARSELDSGKRKGMYRDMATILQNEGGLIAPMFNDYIDATGPGVEGWVEDPNYEMSGGYALQRCWLAA
ncbi:ABC transporter substrate-binding protein [Mesorhizobium sp. M0276]|uniref:ABC transporter substrate-binding protein n=1 Tax=Mesorhizobium sp. M0276 TaxID=2956928 RepID=UPI003338C0AE